LGIEWPSDAKILGAEEEAELPRGLREEAALDGVVMAWSVCD
jgi:hypothetical protein